METKRSKQIKNEVAERIRQLLLENDWYQQRLVDETGGTKSSISNILHGKANITVETIAALEEALGKPIIQVLGKKK